VVVTISQLVSKKYWAFFCEMLKLTIYLSFPTLGKLFGESVSRYRIDSTPFITISRRYLNRAKREQRKIGKTYGSMECLEVWPLDRFFSSTSQTLGKDDGRSSKIEKRLCLTELCIHIQHPIMGHGGSQEAFGRKGGSVEI